jgi:hypothetical protein
MKNLLIKILRTHLVNLWSEFLYSNNYRKGLSYGEVLFYIAYEHGFEQGIGKRVNAVKAPHSEALAHFHTVAETMAYEAFSFRDTKSNDQGE